MNKGLTYIDGKVIVSDENGNHTQIDYYDNIGNVLVKENLIEDLENKIKKLKEESKYYPIKKNIPLFTYIYLVAALLLPTLFVSLTSGTSPINFTPEIIDLDLLLTGLLAPVFLITGIATDISRYKRSKKGKGIKNEIDYLTKELERQKEKLVELQNNKTKEFKSKESYSLKVDDLKKEKYADDFKRISEELNLYYNLGYKEKKYYRYYQKRLLDDKLKEKDSDIVKEYFDDKGPILTKKKH